MRIHRIHTDQALGPGREVCLEEGAAHYLVRVLRVNEGQPVMLFNGDGHDYGAEVVRTGKKSLLLNVLRRLPGAPEPPLRIAVVQALSRGERMDQTLQKCTELGAAAFQPLISERVEVRLNTRKRARRLEHWRRVIVAACEQSGRSVVPVVGEPLELDEWLELTAGACRLVLDPEADSALAHCPITGDEVSLVVGPEGGFSDDELTRMRAQGLIPVRLGPRILRTETAGPAAVAVIQSIAGDLGRV